MTERTPIELSALVLEKLSAALDAYGKWRDKYPTQLGQMHGTMEALALHGGRSGVVWSTATEDLQLRVCRLAYLTREWYATGGADWDGAVSGPRYRNGYEGWNVLDALWHHEDIYTKAYWQKLADRYELTAAKVAHEQTMHAGQQYASRMSAYGAPSEAAVATAQEGLPIIPQATCPEVQLCLQIVALLPE